MQKILTLTLFFRASFIVLPAIAGGGDQYIVEAWKDADSPFVDGHELRLADGIDAPELTQPCVKNGKTWFAGQDAAQAVRAMVKNRQVICTDTGLAKSYGRPLVTCTIDGEPLADKIIRAGWAFDYTKYSHGKHKAAEQAAKADKLGVWAGECKKPWVWRHKWRK